jgi:predicted O-methyltransferase YrrM
MDVLEVLRKIQIPAARRYVSVRRVEGEFMHRWVKDHRLSRTLEVGLAYGTSAACIMSAHEGIHTCIDPFQDHYDDLGLRNLESLGYRERLVFHPHFSHNVLPRLHAEKRAYNFVFIDGCHLFDGVFVDFFYVDLLLEDGGYVLFHDAWMRGTQLVASFVTRNRKDYKRIRCPVKNLIMFQKIAHDERPWYHFREFYTWKSVFMHKALVCMINRGVLQRLLRD